jgi:hypothetical protein
MTLAGSSGNLLIGGTTDITGSGGLKVFGTTASTSTTTGALQVAGGVGVAGAAFVGGNVTVGTGSNLDRDLIINGGAVGSYSSAVRFQSSGTDYWKIGRGSSTGGANFEVYDYQGTPGNRMTIASSTGAATFSGNLTVSGTGTHTFGTTNTVTMAAGVLTTTGAATFGGAIAIGNTVNTVTATLPNRTITMVIGGTTYYIHAKTTND